MDKYRSMLNKISKSERDSIISNNSAEHAIPLVAKLFDRAEKHARIFTESLDPSIYSDDEVVNAVGFFLVGKDGEVDIIVQKDEHDLPDATLKDGNSFLGKLRGRFGDAALKKVNLVRAGQRLRDLDYQFVVVDENAFRFEPDNSRDGALAAFNNADTGAKLSQLFDGFLGKEKRVPATS